MTNAERTMMDASPTEWRLVFDLAREKGVDTERWRMLYAIYLRSPPWDPKIHCSLRERAGPNGESEMNKLPIDDDALNIPQLALKRNAQFRSAVRRAQKLLDAKKGDGMVELVASDKQSKAKIAVLFKSKCFSPDCFSGAEITAILRWRKGSVREADLVLIDMMYELHLSRTKMGDKIPEVLPSIS